MRFHVSPSPQFAKRFDFDALRFDAFTLRETLFDPLNANHRDIICCLVDLTSADADAAALVNILALMNSTSTVRMLAHNGLFMLNLSMVNLPTESVVDYSCCSVRITSLHSRILPELCGLGSGNVEFEVELSDSTLRVKSDMLTLGHYCNSRVLLPYLSDPTTQTFITPGSFQHDLANRRFSGFQRVASCELIEDVAIMLIKDVEEIDVDKRRMHSAVERKTYVKTYFDGAFHMVVDLMVGGKMFMYVGVGYREAAL